MGAVCCSEDNTKSQNGVGDNKTKNRIVSDNFKEDEYGSGPALRTGRHKINEADTASSSLPPSPPRYTHHSVQYRASTGGDTNNNNNNNNAKGKSTSVIAMMETLSADSDVTLPPTKQNRNDSDDIVSVNEPTLVLPQRDISTEKTNTSTQSPQSLQGSPTAASAAGGDDRGKFLRHVNGAASHAVGRTVFEQWCIFLNEVETEDQQKQPQRQSKKTTTATTSTSSSAGTLVNSPEFTDDMDAFRTTNSGNLLMGGATTHSSSRGPGFAGADYAGADVTRTPTSTKVEKWATHDATESVTHESVEEVAKDFMQFLKTDLRSRGWVADFEFGIEGYDATGIVTVNINLLLGQTRRPYSVSIGVKYHAVSLL